MTDWWPRNPTNSGWFAAFTPHWQRPFLPPTSGCGRLRLRRPLPRKQRLFVVLPVAIPILAHADRMLPILGGWLGLGG
ncbi:hypothetical protein [Jiella sonneratiae]|uniref:Uncharacterized protein n=1 Tax=Jiella sonneratiae TaxID=2816856 RepID=A0ABS3J9D0_9HYPH|nr:hypothetical protein [Jiella sonneratiae]MBO0906285.1 hypothetical protein [Jiella sonneratiae]